MMAMQLICVGCFSKSGSDNLNLASDSIQTSHDTLHTEPDIPSYIEKMIKAYPSMGFTYSNNALFFKTGKKILCDDGKKKSFVDMLNSCDIEDMFSIPYRTDSLPPAYLSDAGRGRSEPLFKEMYGHNEPEVRKRLVPVEWFGSKILFSKTNGASAQLLKVRNELAKYPGLVKYLKNASSFYWRKVRGANRQSAHSYGIAIDINTRYSNYWLWSNPKKSELDKISYENKIPSKIVEIFEKYGFIWGGRWYHYDTMHFEYRPELLFNK